MSIKIALDAGHGLYTAGNKIQVELGEVSTEYEPYY